MSTPVRRYALLAAFAELLPVPLLDTVAQNRLRRIAARRTLEARGVKLTDEDLADRVDEPLDIGPRLALWPVNKLLRTVFIGWTALRMWRAASSVMHTAELADLGLLDPEPRAPEPATA